MSLDINLGAIASSSSSSSGTAPPVSKAPSVVVDNKAYEKSWSVLQEKTGMGSGLLGGSLSMSTDRTIAYNARLMQVNADRNNNKYYIIQLLEHSSGQKYMLWTRWGRVGYNLGI